MDFDVAIKQLIQAHEREVTDLRKQIRRSVWSEVERKDSPIRFSERSSSGQCESGYSVQTGLRALPDKSRSYSHRSLKPKTPTSPTRSPPTSPRAGFEGHNLPLDTPHLFGVGSSRRSCPLAPLARAPSPGIAWWKRLENCSTESPSTNPGEESSQSQSGQYTELSLSCQLKSQEFKELISQKTATKSQSSLFASCQSYVSMKYSDDATVGQSITEERYVSEHSDVLMRWEHFAEHLLMHGHEKVFMLHPGWLEEKRDDGIASRKSSYAAWSTVQMSPSTRVSCHTASLTPQQRAALAVMESKAQQLHSLLPGLSHRSTGDLTRVLQRKLSMRKGSRDSQPSYSIDACVMHPASYFRRFWVSCVWLAILYEMFVLTMEPFDIMEGKTALVIEWLSAVFWSCDIVLNFFAGFFAKGRVEMRFRAVAKRYMRTWFLLDLVSAGSQAMAAILQSDGLGAAALLRMMRVFRTYRIGRAIHWMKAELGLGRYVLSGVNLLQFIAVLYLFVHCSACLLFEVGKSNDGWIRRHESHLKDSPWHNYLVCMHWALSQLQGNVDIYPATSSLGLSFVVFSSWGSIVMLTFFVSSTTDTLSDMRQLARRRIDEERLIDDFFTRHVFSPEIRSRAKYYLQLKAKEQSSLEAKTRDQQVLDMFPVQLSAHLLSEIRAFSLVWHPVFSYLQRYHPNTFVKICADVLTHHIYEPSDDVFMCGASSDGAYFIEQGEFVLTASFGLLATITPLLRISAHGSNGSAPSSQLPDRGTLYTTASEKSSDNSIMDQLEQSRPVRKLARGQLVSEVSLWMYWDNFGDLCSTTHGQCFAISTEALLSSLGQQQSAYAVCVSFAMRFHKAALILRHINAIEELRWIELMTFRTVLETEKAEDFEDHVERTQS